MTLGGENKVKVPLQNVFLNIDNPVPRRSMFIYYHMTVREYIIAKRHFNSVHHYDDYNTVLPQPDDVPDDINIFTYIETYPVMSYIMHH